MQEGEIAMFRLLSKKRQLFINDDNIEVGNSGTYYGVHNLQRVLHQPDKQGLVLTSDKPWESQVLHMMSNNVIYDKKSGKFRFWYGCGTRRWYEPCDMEVQSVYMLYAESDDGVHWAKPNLGLYELNGSKNTNICLMAPGCGAMWAGVLEDDRETNPERRFKMLGHGSVGKDHGVVVFFSPDGLHWKPYEYNPVLYSRIDCGDSYTLMGCRDPKSGRFVAAIRPIDWFLSYPQVPFYRYRRGDPQAGDGTGTYSHRRIALSYSDDFTLWTFPDEVLQADFDDPLGTQIQGMTLCPYEDVYIGFLMMHYTDGANDTIDNQLAISSDLKSWHRVGGRKPFLPIGDEGPWESKMVFSISSTPIRVGDELYFYYNAQPNVHWAKYKDRTGAIGLAKLRLDGFVSVCTDGEGFLMTKPFTFEGDTLRVNADAGNGELKVQIVDEVQEPYEGYISKPFKGDSVDHVIEWPDGKSIGDLQGKVVRLKFLMKNMHLFSFAIS